MMVKSDSAHQSSIEVFDEHAYGYSQTIEASLQQFGASHDFFTQHKARLIARLLKGLGRDPASMSLLDVGCGIGNIHSLIGPKFKALHGVDVSSASIQEAQARFPTYTYSTYDGHRLPYDDGTMDMTLAICVFHHVPPAFWAQLATEMMRVLRPGGIALIIEHNPWNPITRHIVNTCPIDVDAVLLKRATTVGLFRAAGAQKVVARYIMAVPPKTDFLMSVDGIFGRLPLGAQYYCAALKQS